MDDRCDYFLLCVGSRFFCIARARVEASMTTAERHAQTRKENFAQSARTRTARKLVRRQLKANTLTLKDAMKEPSVQGMTTYKLVISMFRMGEARTVQVLSRNGISPYWQVSEMTARQRKALLADPIIQHRTRRTIGR
jgi:hypothetical protein